MNTWIKSLSPVTLEKRGRQSENRGEITKEHENNEVLLCEQVGPAQVEGLSLHQEELRWRKGKVTGASVQGPDMYGMSVWIRKKLPPLSEGVSKRCLPWIDARTHSLISRVWAKSQPHLPPHSTHLFRAQIIQLCTMTLPMIIKSLLLTKHLLHIVLYNSHHSFRNTDIHVSD